MSINSKHTLPQIIVTGNPVDENKANEIRAFCAQMMEVFAIDWCHPDGTIGYMDASIIPLSEPQLRQILKTIAKKFMFLDIGVTLMSGSVGAYNEPLISFLVKSGKVTENDACHAMHPAPKRYKKKETLVKAA